jgi:hypothetical protein
MKIRNKTKYTQEISIDGRVTQVKPNEIVEVRKFIYNDNAFEIIFEQKNEVEKLNFVKKYRNKKERKLNDTSK